MTRKIGTRQNELTIKKTSITLFIFCLCTCFIVLFIWFFFASFNHMKYVFYVAWNIRMGKIKDYMNTPPPQKKIVTKLEAIFNRRFDKHISVYTSYLYQYVIFANPGKETYEFSHIFKINNRFDLWQSFKDISYDCFVKPSPDWFHDKTFSLQLKLYWLNHFYLCRSVFVSS